MPAYPSDHYNLPQTDHTRWRLETDSVGRQVWKYYREGAVCPDATPFDVYQMGTGSFPEAEESPNSAGEAAFRTFRFLSNIQDKNSGIFPCQYGGPMFMLIGYVAIKYYSKIPFSEEERVEITRYLINRAHPVDGGWGLHSYGESTTFGTSINYVILRILGMRADHPAMIKARKTLHRLGGAIGNPMWGKVYLALLNLYSWDGVNPSPPEFWLMPYSVPIHPGRWWVHTRAIYLPMSYIAMFKIQTELDPLLTELRSEIYTKPYDSIDFSQHRNTVCGVDLYYPHTKLLNFANATLKFYENNLRPDWLKKKAAAKVLELVLKDLKNTDWLAIAPISNVMNAFVIHHALGPESDEFQRFLGRWPDFLYMTPEGMLMGGTNGVQVWDAAFALQYCVVAGLAEKEEFRDTLVRGYRFLLRSQFTEDCEPDSFRDHRNGGFPFSTKPQGFTVSDCTAEAIKAIIMVQNVKGLEFLKSEITDQRLFDGIDTLLSLQNVESFHFGSFASYEKIKGPEFLEKLNPAEVFGNIMVEYPYVECTDSSTLGLVTFAENYDYRKDDIKAAIANAIDYIASYQRPDGSWYGSWGVCFTYAGMFAIEALATQGRTYANCEVVKRGCDYLVKRQEADGGWAEDFRSCEMFSYVHHSSSQVVQTAWSLIALILAEYPDRSVLDKAKDFLIKKQHLDGSYGFNHVEGVFNHSCAIEYPNYKFYFPVKALGMYSCRYEQA